MHLEIENLINMALADGEVTEKERAIILRKAETLGLDPDEVEMVLDGKLHQLESSKPKQKEKVGNIKTCPSCGCVVKALDFTCDDCGHEFSNRSSNSNLIELEKKLLKANDDDSRIRIINDHPISNDKETLFELLSYMSSKVTSSDSGSNYALINAYQSRAVEITTKLRFICSSDPLLMEQLNQLSAKMNNSKSKNAFTSVIKWSLFFVLWCLFTYLMIATIARIFGAHWWPY